MKRLLMLVCLFGLTAAAAHAQPGHFMISFDAFYSSLGPHGEWIYIDRGVYAWRPVRVSYDWRPYAYGRWVWSSYGWYWVSEEPWAWAAYHYGRWHFDPYYGWIWIPGYDWAPAWVEWRYGDDCVGWAPLGPYASFDPRRGIYYESRWRTPHTWWTFVDYGSMTRRDVYRYRYRDDEIPRLIGQTRYSGDVRYRGSTVVTAGPTREFVERRGNVRIRPADIVDVDTRERARVTTQGDRDRIEVYRPRVSTETAGRPDRPDRVTRADRKPDIQSDQIYDRERRRSTRQTAPSTPSYDQKNSRDRDQARPSQPPPRESGRSEPEKRSPSVTPPSREPGQPSAPSQQQVPPPRDRGRPNGR